MENDSGNVDEKLVRTSNGAGVIIVIDGEQWAVRSTNLRDEWKQWKIDRQRERERERSGASFCKGGDTPERNWLRDKPLSATSGRGILGISWKREGNMGNGGWRAVGCCESWDLERVRGPVGGRQLWWMGWIGWGHTKIADVAASGGHVRVHRPWRYAILPRTLVLLFIFYFFTFL